MNGKGGLVHWDDVEPQKDDEGHFGAAWRFLGRAAGCVEVTVNRGDLLSHVGLARELSSAGSGDVALTAIPGAGSPTFRYEQGSPEGAKERILSAAHQRVVKS